MAQFSFSDDRYDAAIGTGVILLFIIQIFISDYWIAGICLPQ